jgi:hypothetical protein
MPRQDPYDEQLKKDLNKLIDALDLPDPFQKQCLRLRWVDQILWMEDRSNKAQRSYYVLRLTTIICGVIIPALVTLTTTGFAQTSTWIGLTVGWTTFGLSLIVALSAAIEQFFNYGERWRHYRRMVETLKIEGWLFFQLSGHYHRYKSHARAYHLFAARTEEINHRDVQAYITGVVQERADDKEETTSEAATQS